MDQLSEDQRHMLPSALLGPLTRMGEKVAAIEGRFGAEITALKEDTAQIRRMLHDMANAQQVSIGAEARCALQLVSISEKLSAHADQVTLNVTMQKETMAELRVQLSTLSAKVESLINNWHWVEGGWWTLLKVGAVIVGVSALAWNTLSHFRITP